ncbi:MAG: hypothetical protein AAF628_21670 [Planctomycetota bacterium]
MVRTFVVLPKTIGRCGSTWLCDLIDSHPDASCLGEVFNPDQRETYHDLFGCLGESQDPARLFGCLATLLPGARVWGFKLFRQTLGDRLLREVLAHVDAVVLINRQNLTQALASELHARETKLWHVRDEALPADALQHRIVIDVEAARERLASAVATGVAIERMLGETGVPSVEIDYEQLVASTETCMAQVFSFLALPPAAVRSTYRKIHGDSAFVANLDEVNRELGPSFGYLVV